MFLINNLVFIGSPRVLGYLLKIKLEVVFMTDVRLERLDNYFDEELEEVREAAADMTEKELREFLELLNIEEWF
jgi:hypothetical protein